MIMPLYIMQKNIHICMEHLPFHITAHSPRFVCALDPIFEELVFLLLTYKVITKIYALYNFLLTSVV